jgi:pimeloyl-ACP methyl ester carboxylesterase
MSGTVTQRAPRPHARRPAGALNVVRWGAGERVVCVHGSLSWGEFAFRRQRPLAHSHELVLPDRRGYGATPAGGRVDFDVDAEDVAGLLGDSAHLVGHSYGALAALLVAARRPDAVRTLTIVEPAAFAVARGDAAVEEVIAGLECVYAAAAGLTAAEFGVRFLEAFGYRRGLDMPERPKLTPNASRAATATMTERPAWEAEIPLAALGSAPHPTLVVSGRWDNLASGEHAVGHAAIGAVCDTLTRALDARRVTIDGWAHGCQYSGKPFNDALQSFWSDR